MRFERGIQMEIDSDLIAIVKSELVFEGGGSSIELLMQSNQHQGF